MAENKDTIKTVKKTTTPKQVPKQIKKNDEPKSQKIVAKNIDLNQYVTVRNGFYGKLIYKSKKTGETFIFDEFGSEQDMELKELKDAKNTYKKLFVNNWFMFDEDWVPEFLGVSQYYKNALNIEEFDKLLDKPSTEVKKVVSKMSDGQKKSLKYRAIELIKDGKIDSIKTITALEEMLHTKLIEK